MSIPLASPARATSLSEPERTQLLDDIEAYLNRLTTLQAGFTQVAPDGAVAEGTFSLSRPGKLRWEYNPPVPVLIVVNGSIMAYQDKELDQISHLPTESNLMGLFARSSINLREELIIEKLEKQAGVIRMKVRQKGREEEGALTMIFDASPLTIRKLEVLDATNQLTVIALHDLTYGLALADDLFTLDYLAHQQKRRRN